MLNKKNCIGNRKVIEELFRKGRLYKNDFLIFKYKITSNQQSQFAVSVSKKILKKAVKRNHLRRQIHEGLRLNLSLLKKPIISLLIARPSSQKASFQEINQNIQTFFNTLNTNAE